MFRPEHSLRSGKLTRNLFRPEHRSSRTNGFRRFGRWASCPLRQGLDVRIASAKNSGWIVGIFSLLLLAAA
jgi:hypothetical protein